MLVYLFRHGQTAGNAEGKYLGITDEPLCTLGIETAKAAGSDPSVQEVIVTPLRRTQMTAAILYQVQRQLKVRTVAIVWIGNRMRTRMVE